LEGRTHILGGLVAGAALAPILSPEHLLPFVVAAALAGPLPDIDHPGSMYGRYVPLPGVVKNYGKVEPYKGGLFGNTAHSFGHVGRRTPFGILWHRGPTHSLVFAAVFGVVAFLIVHALAPAVALAIGLGIAVGALSHLALDEMNVSGEHLLWPLSGKEIRLKWPHIRVGTAGEILVVVGLIIVGAFTIPHLVLPHTHIALFRTTGSHR